MKRSEPALRDDAAGGPSRKGSHNARPTLPPSKTDPAPRSRLWLWVVAAFVFQLGVWTAWIVIASNNRVAEVPLATGRPR